MSLLSSSITKMTKTERVEKRQEPRYARLQVRMYAGIVDVLLLTPIYFLLIRLRDMPERLAILNDQYAQKLISQHELIMGTKHYFLYEGGWQLMAINTLMDVIILGILIITCWHFWSATPGKKLFSLKVVDEETLEKPATSQLVVRFLGYLTLGFVWIPFNKRRQGWHDIFAHTLVIHTKPLDPNWKEKRFKRQTIMAVLFLLIFAIYMAVRS